LQFCIRRLYIRVRFPIITKALNLQGLPDYFFRAGIAQVKPYGILTTLRQLPLLK
jgi:hypothetical protein